MDPTEFEQQLANQGQNYQLLTPLGEAHCHLRFTGPFQGKPVLWDAYLQTLSYYVRHHSPVLNCARQFLEVGETGEHGRLIRIGLNLPVIDEPVILKTLIMIRQYKRLAPGRHEFGELIHFTK
jgi:hypothetical protein